MIMGRLRPQASYDLCLCIRNESVFPGSCTRLKLSFRYDIVHGRDLERQSRERAGAGNSSRRKIHISVDLNE